MSRVSKWKLEKTKVKVVFRLQFHATHVPQTGWDKLFISFIPTDSGKATAKTTKASVRNGACKWADPIYETTRLLQDSKSKQYDEKLYKIVVAMGTSRASILGEAIINLADYVDALKPSAATLPLNGCNFGTILHITIQLLTSKTGFREFEQQRELREKGIQFGPDSHAAGKIQSPGEAANFQDDKVSSSLEEEVKSIEEYADKSTALDASSNTSESFYEERHETPSTHEMDSLKSISGSHNPNTDSMGPTDELAVVKESLELAESSLFDLKLEVSSLQSLADELGSETQRLSRQLAAEVSSSEQLAREVSVMKLECREFKEDIVKLRDLNSSPREIRAEQLQFSKGIAMVESKIRELQSKTRVAPHGGDPKFVYAELEVLLDFLLGLKLENGNGLGLDLCQPESILPNPPGDTDAMRGQILDLVRELDESRVEKEALVRKTNQMECYYEALIHELEENQKRLLGELQHVRNEHSACLYTFSVAKSEVESLSHDLSQQMVLNEELERRTVASEASLRRARLNYSIAVDKLQKDLQLLSSQVTSMFETNENLIKQALPTQDMKRSVGRGDLLLLDLRRSLRVQEEQFKKVERELTEIYSVNLELDVHSRVLQESLNEADVSIKLSMDSQNQLVMRLEKAMDDIHMLNEYKLSSISHCSELALQNQLLEDRLMSASEENYLLDQKVKDFERAMMEYESNQSMYAACLAENEELSRHLEQKGSENKKLASEILTLKEKSMMLKSESGELVSLKKNLEESISCIREKLANLLASYSMQFPFVGNFQNLDLESVDLKDAALKLEEIQLSVYAKYCELVDENQKLKSERAIAEVSLSSFMSETLETKQKFRSTLEEVVAKLQVSNTLIDKLQAELKSVDNKLCLSSEIEEKHICLNKALLADLSDWEDQMQELTSKNGHLADDVSILDALAEELERSELTISKLMREKQELSMSLQERTKESTKLSGEIIHLKETLKVLHDELFMEKACRDELEGKVGDLSFLLNKTRDELLSHEQEKSELVHVRELASEHEFEKLRLARLLGQQNVLIDELERNNSHHAGLESQLVELHEHSLAADVRLTYATSHYEAIIKELLQRSDSTISKLMCDREELSKSLQEKTENSTKLSGEISRLKENSKVLHDELCMEKACRGELEGKVRDLSFHLNKAWDELLGFEQQRSELVQVRELASEHECEKLRLASLLSEQNLLLEDLKGNISYHAGLESELLEMHELSLAADVRFIYVEDHYGVTVEELIQKLMSSEGCLMELQKKHHETEAMLNHCLACEANWTEERLNLLASLKTVRSHLEDSEAQTKLLSDANKETRHQLEEYRNKLAMVRDVEQEILDLALSNKEFEILVTVLESKIHEQSASIASLEGSKDQLSVKLSEQVLKTEEFRNLSTHLKELKDKAEAECLVARGKRATEAAPPSSGQDSLRIAFMKEQYETQVQELKQQVSMLRKHGEEMLLRLQDAIDEVENRKKSEAVNLKRNEELSARLSALEEELHSAKAEKCEKTNAYDRAKAELECALLSLECCKEEKEKLGSSLLGFEEEKSRLATELELVKARLEDSKSPTRFVNEVQHVVNGLTRNSLTYSFEQDDATPGGENESHISNGHNVDSTEPGQLPIIQENSGAQRLRSSIEHLHEELEKMKNENKADGISHGIDPDIQLLQREIEKLHKANEELGSMFPMFHEISAGENALERVLALEIELAEALTTKSKSSKVLFQSSFLKQHGDEEAIFKSFRDINEVIRETLEQKERRAAMEAELRDMHERYSRLSLQFAEVEGDRQKLRMTLKNVRSARKLVPSNSPNVTDPS